MMNFTEKRVLVVGASGGIGQALCQEMSARGAHVTPLSRSIDGLDITNETSIETHLATLEPPFDIVLVATGALDPNGHQPEKSIAHVTAEGLTQHFLLNTIGPALVIKHAIPLLHKDRPTLIAALSARVGSIKDNRLGGWTSYRASKAALNQIVHTTAVELSRTHKLATCVALHPGTVVTPLTRTYLGRHPAVSASEAADNLLRVLTQLGPEHSGGFYDWAGKEIPW
jgi:NAD(P)-dependent dehydrogenase (short-subunit alcohol dehydrogenase family)